MNALSKLWSAFHRLADNLLALAETVGCANAALRQRVGLDSPEVIDGHPDATDAILEARNGMPAALPAGGRKPRKGN